MTILYFEVANTIMKGAKLMQSLSEESFRHLKEVVLPVEGVQRLISKDTKELLRIAASHKRFLAELEAFVSDGNKLDDNMPRAAISEPIENSTSVSAISVPLYEFRLPKEEASVVQSNGTPVIYAPSNMQQLAIKSISAEKGAQLHCSLFEDVLAFIQFPGFSY